MTFRRFGSRVRSIHPDRIQRCRQSALSGCRWLVPPLSRPPGDSASGNVQLSAKFC